MIAAELNRLLDSQQTYFDTVERYIAAADQFLVMEQQRTLELQRLNADLAAALAQADEILRMTREL